MRTFICLIALLIPATASAQTLIGSQGQWDIYKSEQDGKSFCYLATAPIKSTGNFKSRSEPYLLVAQTPNGDVEVNASSGFLYKSTGAATLQVDNVKFPLVTKDNQGWTKDDAADAAAVAAMKRGQSVTLKGTAKKGTEAQDIFSLTGFSAALRQMNAECQ